VLVQAFVTPQVDACKLKVVISSLIKKKKKFYTVFLVKKQQVLKYMISGPRENAPIPERYINDEPAFRIRMFLGLLDPHPDPLVTSKDPDSDLDPDTSHESVERTGERVEKKTFKTTIFMLKI
jgi:hypothetical protein